MVVKRLIDGRFQFLRVVSTKAYTKTYLMTDHNDADKAKCIVKHLELPAHNATTRKFLSDLLSKRVNLLQRLGDHPAIASHRATVQEGPNFYWVRSYIPGHPLTQDLGTPQPQTEAAVRQFLQESLGILEFLQRHGIAHQNLHPNNLIRHPDGHLVLVDFGLVQDMSAPDLSEGDGSTETSVATAYLPHGQRQQYARFAADHFALGMAAVQMATGLSMEAMPHPRQEDFWPQIKLQLDECSTLSPELKDILLAMVTADPAAQPPLAKDILAALNCPPAAATGEAPPPEPPPPVLETPKPSGARGFGRRLTWLGAGTALGLLALAGLGLRQVPQSLTVNSLLQQAETARQQGQTTDSLAYLNQALDLAPSHSPALAQRSNLLWQTGQLEQALQDLTLAIEADPAAADLYYQRGNLRLQMGDLQGAIDDYSAALERQESFADALINRGNARADLGDETGALADYNAAVTLASDPDTQVDAYLNRCLTHSNLGNHSVALEDCTAAINLRPSSSYAYENRGLVKRRLRDFQGAIQDFTIAIQIDASSPEPYYNRGLTRLDLGDFAGAMADFDRTIELNPKHPFAYYDRGLLHAERGDFESAIADLETVASACLDVSRLGCFDDAQYQLERIRAKQAEQP